MREYIVTAEILTPEIRNILSKFEVVRCRDCRYYEHEVFTFGEETHYCWRDWNCEPVGVYVEPDGFCAWGERKVEG